MSEQPVRTVVIGALDRAAGILNVPELARQVLTGGDLDLTGLEVDSLSNLEFIMEVEDAFGIELDAGKVAAQTTLNGLIAHIKAHLGQDAG